MESVTDHIVADHSSTDHTVADDFRERTRIGIRPAHQRRSFPRRDAVERYGEQRATLVFDSEEPVGVRRYVRTI